MLFNSTFSNVNGDQLVNILFTLNLRQVNSKFIVIKEKC